MARRLSDRLRARLLIRLAEEPQSEVVAREFHVSRQLVDYYRRRLTAGPSAMAARPRRRLIPDLTGRSNTFLTDAERRRLNRFLAGPPALVAQAQAGDAAAREILAATYHVSFLPPVSV